MRTRREQAIPPSSGGRAKLHVFDSLPEHAGNRTTDDVPREIEVCPPNDGEWRTVMQDMHVVRSSLVFIGSPQKPVVASILAPGRTRGKLTLPFPFLKYLFALS
jgi:hypothetical protein